MKLLRWILPIVAIAFVSPASAQTGDPSLQQGVERIVASFTEHFNKQDAVGIAELFTQDGVLVSQSPAGAVKSGIQAIAQNYYGAFKIGANHIDITLSQVAQLGDDVAIAWGGYQTTGEGQSGPMKLDGDWSATYVRNGGTWKLRLLNAIPKPPATPTK